MAIQFVRIEIVGRSRGGNACCKGAYNARIIVKDERTNITYNFKNRGDNVYHEVLLPEYVNAKYKDVSVLMNMVEKMERQKNSQLLKDVVIALPDDKELNLEDRINITQRIIAEMGWVEEGLGVQIDIHQPHDGEHNWHAHLLVTTRRFTKCGEYLEAKKARDLNPQFATVGGKSFIIPEEDIIHEKAKRIINEYFAELGLENRVDEIGIVPQEHIGPVRMRGIINEVAERNEIRKRINIESLVGGEEVLDRISRNHSVFSVNDLKRVVKCIGDYKIRGDLVREALKSERLVKLLDEKGNDSGLYTTKEIRLEEHKLVRLATYISHQNNLTSNRLMGFFIKELEKAMPEITGLQKEALKHLFLGQGGIRILKGRAGTGKSYVLRNMVDAAKLSKVGIMGLAPTHKAKLELEKNGYRECDTVKGFLFKLYNGKVSLARNSVIVVDEAGMVGNADYLELLRVAASHKCNVILSGDDRQLGSISRGGMFKVFGDRFGYVELKEVVRQRTGWGKEVSRLCAEGAYREAIKLLDKHQAIVYKDNKEEKLLQLMSDWQNSRYEIKDRLVIAIKNEDVEVLNAVIRENLKGLGYLRGVEYGLRSQKKINLAKISPELEKLYGDKVLNEHVRYMVGDRVLFKASNRRLGISNGDFGIIESLSEFEFKVRLDSGREVSFNPEEFDGFRHGYASTVYKAQGASIKEVYVLHDGFGTQQNSYVAMSRFVEEMRLYVSYDKTRDVNELVRQLDCNWDHGSSLNYQSRDEVELEAKIREEEERRGLFGNLVQKLGSYAKEQVTIMVDKYKVNEDYYEFESEVVAPARVEKVLDEVVGHGIKDEGVRENKLDEGVKEQGEGISVTSLSKSKGQGQDELESAVKKVEPSGSGGPRRQTAKEKFYAHRDKVAERKERSIIANESREHYERMVEEIRQKVRFNGRVLVEEMLGEANMRLSNSQTFRYGKSGKLAVRVSGEKAGHWYDFSKSEGGDMFDLVQEIKGGDFKEAVDYLQDRLNIRSYDNLAHVYSHEVKNKYVDYHKQNSQERAEEAGKIRKAVRLYSKAQSIDEGSVAAKYLSEARKINCEVGRDIKTIEVYDKESGKKYPALVGFARNRAGKVTGGQQILLDIESNNKAEVGVVKRSFGKIGGSFVEIANPKVEEDKEVTIIAEGLETALSIKASGVEGRVICSLGISNIRNYEARLGEKIIIAADNDGEQAASNKVIEQAVLGLSDKALVEVVRPKDMGEKRISDFNDILHHRGADEGILEIREILQSAIDKLNRYSKEQAEIIVDYRQYEYKQSDIEQYLSENEQELDNLRKFNPSYDTSKLRGTLAEFTDYTRDKLLEHELEKEFRPYIMSHEQRFEVAKLEARSLEKLLEVYKEEKEFCGEMYDKYYRLLSGLSYQNSKSVTLSKYIMYDNEARLIEHLQERLEETVRLGIIKGDRVVEYLQRERNIGFVVSDLSRQCERYYIKEKRVAVGNMLKQIDIELGSSEVRSLCPGEALERIKEKAVYYGISRYKQQGNNMLSSDALKAVISRSVFEVKYEQDVREVIKKHITFKYGDKIIDLGGRLEEEYLADKVTKASGYLVEKKVKEQPELYLQFGEKLAVNKIIKEGFGICNLKQDKLKEVIEGDINIRKFKDKGDDFVERVAEQLVDYRQEHGEGVVITEGLFKAMENAAKLEQEVRVDSELKLYVELHDGFVRSEMGVEDQRIAIDMGMKLLSNNIRDREQQRYVFKDLELEGYISGDEGNHLSQEQYSKQIVQRVVSRALEVQHEFEREILHHDELKHDELEEQEGSTMKMRGPSLGM